MVAHNLLRCFRPWACLPLPIAIVSVGHDTRVVRSVVLPVLFIWFMLKSVIAYSALVGGAFKVPVARTILVFDVVLTVVYGYFLLVNWGDPER
jgi:hypothetical protein